MSINLENTPVVLPPKYLAAETVEDVAALMTGLAIPFKGATGPYSLIAHLDVLGVGEGTVPPEIVALTLNSCAPVADSIRGVYQAAGIAEPLLIGVNSSHDNQGDYYHNPRAKLEEVFRLRQKLDGRQSMVVIDEFVAGGTSLHLAIKLLCAAGADENRVQRIRGRWYQKAPAEINDPINLTSALARQMFDIGTRCVELAQK